MDTYLHPVPSIATTHPKLQDNRHVGWEILPSHTTAMAIAQMGKHRGQLSFRRFHDSSVVEVPIVGGVNLTNT